MNMRRASYINNIECNSVCILFVCVCFTEFVCIGSVVIRFPCYIVNHRFNSIPTLVFLCYIFMCTMRGLT